MASNLHVSISAEPLFDVAGFTVTNSILTGFGVSILLIIFSLYFSTLKKDYKKVNKLQLIVEMFIEGIFGLAKDVAGEKKAREFFPLVASAIIFILFNNWVSVLPGVGTIGLSQDEEKESHVSIAPQAYATTINTQASEASTLDSAPQEDHGDQKTSEIVGDTQDDSQHDAQADEAKHSKFIPIIRPATADLNTTIALALITMVLVQYYGVKHLGFGYFKKFFNFSQGPIFTFVGILELVSDFSKVISFAFRLFGNIFAGEVLLSVIAFLVPLAAPIPFLGMEIFVGFIQALVFAMLTLVFINMATIGHDDHH